MTPRAAVKLLLGFVLGLPIIQAIFAWVASLMAAMGDETTATVLGHINNITRIAWIVSLVGLVVVLAIQSLEKTNNNTQ